MMIWKHKKVVYVIFAFLLIGMVLLFVTSQNNTVSREKQSQLSQGPYAVGEGKIIAGEFDKTKFKTDAQWQQILSPEEFTILRREGTEQPYTGELLDEKRAGTYYSVGCDVPLFRSEQKYDSQTGWPSFWAPIDDDSLVLREDTTLPGLARVEVLDRCGNHLGHLFEDGPQPTGKRYCINSAALRFAPDEKSIR